jgi:hypothetical protein
MTKSHGEIVVLVLANKIESLLYLSKLLGSALPVIAHIDAKTHLSAEAKVSLSSISLLEQRLPIYWGGFNMSLATISLIDEAYRLYPNFSRLILISGDALPCVSADRMRDLFSEHYHTEFVQLVDVANDRSLRDVPVEEARAKHAGSVNPWRFQNFIFYDSDLHCPRSRDMVMRKFSVPETHVDSLRGAAHTTMKGVMRCLPDRDQIYEKFYFGSQWWSLSRFAVDLIVDDLHSQVHQEFFRFLQVSDEHLIHTLIGSKRAILEGRGIEKFRPIMHVINHPDRAKFLDSDFMTKQDLVHAARHSNRIFVRKFRPDAAPEISEAIDNGRYDALLAQSVDG